MKVMIATDGTATSIGAAREALRLLHPDARIELVTIVPARTDVEADAGGIEGPLLTPEEADREWEQAVAAGHHALQRTIDELAERVAEARVVESDESVDRALVRLVEAEHPDLLVLGSNERGWFDRLLHGATDDRLLRHAPCPLLVVSHRE